MRMHCTRCDLRVRLPRLGPQPSVKFGRESQNCEETPRTEITSLESSEYPSHHDLLFANCLALADQLAQGRHRVFERKSAGLLIKRAVTIGNFYTAFRNFELRLQFVLGAKKGGNIWPSTRPAPPHRSSRSDQRIAHSPLTGPPDRLVCKYRRISAYAPSMLRFLEALPGRSAALSVWVLLLLSADPVLCRSSRLLSGSTPHPGPISVSPLD